MSIQRTFIDDKLGLSELIPSPLYFQEWSYSDNRQFLNHVITENDKYQQDRYIETPNGRYERLMNNDAKNKATYDESLKYKGNQPYGQYMNSFNVLPNDEEYILNNTTTTPQVLSFLHNNFMRQNLLNEATNSQNIQLKLQRSQIHNSQNFYSPANIN